MTADPSPSRPLAPLLRVFIEDPDADVAGIFVEIPQLYASREAFRTALVDWLLSDLFARPYVEVPDLRGKRAYFTLPSVRVRYVPVPRTGPSGKPRASLRRWTREREGADLERIDAILARVDVPRSRNGAHENARIEVREEG